MVENAKLVMFGDFVADKDIIQTLADGRTVQLYAAGTVIPFREAVKLGLVEEGGRPIHPEVKNVQHYDENVPVQSTAPVTPRGFKPAKVD
jgi:hypothetical protein